MQLEQGKESRYITTTILTTKTNNDKTNKLTNKNIDIHQFGKVRLIQVQALI